jgi:hypothetical protein
MSGVAKSWWILLLLLALISSAAVADDPAPQYSCVGILPVQNDSKLRGAAEQLTSRLATVLGERFEEVEFIIIEPDEQQEDNEPVLLKKAVKFGQQYEVEALLTGVFDGVEIVGGTWPNRGGDYPQARGFHHWRLVECSQGLLVADGAIKPDKPKIYPQRIRSSEELIKRVLQDIAVAQADDLEETALLLGTKPPPGENDNQTGEDE